MIKLKQVKKDAKVTVGATSFNEIYDSICRAKEDPLKIESFMNKVNTEITKVNDERYKMSTVNRKYTFLANTVDDILEFLLIILGVAMITLGKLTIANFVVVGYKSYKF